jgi:hypothetical protein
MGEAYDDENGFDFDAAVDSLYEELCYRPPEEWRKALRVALDDAWFAGHEAAWEDQDWDDHDCESEE